MARMQADVQTPASWSSVGLPVCQITYSLIIAILVACSCSRKSLREGLGELKEELKGGGYYENFTPPLIDVVKRKRKGMC